MAAVLSTLKQLPEIKHTYTTIGAGDTGTVRDVHMFIKLKERSERSRSQTQLQEEVRRTCHGDSGDFAFDHGSRPDGQPKTIDRRYPRGRYLPA